MSFVLELAEVLAEVLVTLVLVLELQLLQEVLQLMVQPAREGNMGCIQLLTWRQT